MPHTNSRTSQASKHKATKPIHTKRQIVESEDGWAKVVGGRTRKPNTNAKTRGEAESDFSIGPYHYVTKTLEEVKEEYERSWKRWKESEDCEMLRERLVRVKETLKNNKRVISNIVVLGLGSFQNAESTHTSNSYSQLAALETLITELGLEDLPVIQQDPAFTELDAKFVATLSPPQTVVEDPKAFDQVKEGSLVYAVHCYPEIYDKVRKIATPVFLIGNDLDGKDDKDFVERYPEIQKLYDGMEKTFTMPRYGDTFSDTIVFIRKPSKPSATTEETPETKPSES